ncbi:type II toxin-antitoxin system VapC family toxin [Thermococcus thermotolerans]|uniref:type II toxin-antitoxin system VapC family toxin n=1 Tax=Thermococcus thermotolerans TaxID=2969672 RepID=UPI0021575FE9|nr:type II toxin-antitoxin system VapC family toxin [Thermococcus thermotolerans]
MIVADASFIVDALIVPRRRKKDELYFKQLKRHQRAKELLSIFLEEGFQIYMPFLGLVEVSSLLTRKLGKDANADTVLSFLEKYILIVSEEELKRTLLTLAKETGSRAADIYYISVAKSKGAVLVTADRKMADVSKELGVKVVLLE